MSAISLTPSHPSCARVAPCADVAAVLHAVELDRATRRRTRGRSPRRKSVAATDDRQHAAAGGDDAAVPLAPCRREIRDTLERADAASRPAIGSAASSPDPGYPPEASTTPTSWSRLNAIGAASSAPSGRSGEQVRRQRAVDRRYHDLRLGVAEPDVELDHLGAVAGQHQPGVQESAVLGCPRRASPRNDRLDDLAHDRSPASPRRPAGSARTRPCRRCSAPRSPSKTRL